jgi:hypothetical protein
MKKILSIMFIFVLLTGCTEKVSTGISYFAGVADYLGDVNEFKSQIPQLTAGSLADSTTRDELKTAITEMQGDIDDFNSLVPPDELKTMHESVVAKNETFDKKLQDSLTIIESGEKNASEIQTMVSGSVVTDIINSLTDLNKEK